MKTILAVLDYYLPGYKGGGPIRAISNLVDQMGDEYAFYILTRDRDLGDDAPYPSVQHGEWMPVGKTVVRYLAPEDMTLRGWRRVLTDRSLLARAGLRPTPIPSLSNTSTAGTQHSASLPDETALYLNSFFSVHSVRIMLLRWLRLIPRTPVILAPRGEFFPGALALKTRKKWLYLTVARLLRLYKDVIWQATAEDERKAILRIFPKVECHIAPDLTEQILTLPVPRKSDKLKAIFLSRIARNKNLDYALRLLAEVRANIQFDIYGPTEDQAYWQECQSLIAALPENVHVEYKGVVLPDDVLNTFAQYHLFLFPTQGENFGHVIWEALAGASLVLTSDQTPWHDLEAHGIGWTLPLDNPAAFLAALDEVTRMNSCEFTNRANTAQEYAMRVSKNDKALAYYHTLFNKA